MIWTTQVPADGDWWWRPNAWTSPIAARVRNGYVYFVGTHHAYHARLREGEWCRMPVPTGE